MSNSLHRAFLVHLVCLVCLVCLVEQDQLDELNKPDEPDRPSRIISATSMQVKFATNRLLKPLCSVVGSILSTEEAHAQIVQICRSGGGRHSVIPGIE